MLIENTLLPFDKYAFNIYTLKLQKYSLTSRILRQLYKLIILRQLYKLITFLYRQPCHCVVNEYIQQRGQYENNGTKH